ncbi:MAG TPA: universal stress protein [Nitrospiria bacterium]|nr:universal stress protein [Nitrospiria bacterium]
MVAFKTILVATDLSRYSDEALEYAVEMARVQKGRILLVHVFEPPFLGQAGIDFSMGPEVHQWFQGLRKEVEGKLGEQAKDLRKKGLEIEPFVREGIPYSEILKAAEEADADLIILGTHGRTGLGHMLLGSVAERVVRRALCPVLTVRPKEIPAEKETETVPS